MKKEEAEETAEPANGEWSLVQFSEYEIVSISFHRKIIISVGDSVEATAEAVSSTET